MRFAVILAESRRAFSDEPPALPSRPEVVACEDARVAADERAGSLRLGKQVMMQNAKTTALLDKPIVVLHYPPGKTYEIKLGDDTFGAVTMPGYSDGFPRN